MRVDVVGIAEQLGDTGVGVEQIGAVVEDGGHGAGREQQRVLLALEEKQLGLADVLVPHPRNGQQRQYQQQQLCANTDSA